MAQRLSREAKALAGKSGGADSSVWLPLWIHLRDTAGIMAHLVRERLSSAAWEAFGLEMEELEHVARFLGAASCGRTITRSPSKRTAATNRERSTVMMPM